MQPVTALSPVPAPQPAPAGGDPATPPDDGFAALLAEPAPAEPEAGGTPSDIPAAPEQAAPSAEDAAPDLGAQPIPFWAAAGQPATAAPGPAVHAGPAAATPALPDMPAATSPEVPVPLPEPSGQPPTPVDPKAGDQPDGAAPTRVPPEPEGLAAPSAPFTAAAMVAPAPPARPDPPEQPDSPEGQPSYWSLRAAPPQQPDRVATQSAAPQELAAAAPATFSAADAPQTALQIFDPMLAETGSSASAGLAPPLAVSANAQPAAPASLPGSPALPQSVARDLAVVIASGPTGTVELRLSPEELGHVRLSLSGEADRVIVTIQAERAETLDLLRRHADSLMTELRSFGFTGGTLSFSGWHRPPPQTAGPAAEGSGFVIEAPSPAPAAGPAGASLLLRL